MPASWALPVAVTSGIVGISAIVVFFPYFSQQSAGLVVPTDVLVSKLIELDGAIHSGEYLSALAMACVLAIPMAVDVVLDGEKLVQQSGSERVHWAVRCLVLSATTLPNLAILYRTRNGGGSAGADVLMFLTVDKFIKVVATGGLLLFFAVDHHGVGIGPLCAWAALLIGLSQCFTVAHDVAAHGHDAFYVLALACEVAAVLVGLACVAKWLLHWRRAGRRATADDVCYAMYLVAIAVFALGHIAVSGAYGSGAEFAYGDASPACLSAYVYVRMAFLVIVMKVRPLSLTPLPHPSPSPLSVNLPRHRHEGAASDARTHVPYSLFFLFRVAPIIHPH